MTFDDYDDDDLLELYRESSAMLRKVIEQQQRSLIGEYVIRHRAISDVCTARGLVVVEVSDWPSESTGEMPPAKSSRAPKPCKK